MSDLRIIPIDECKRKKHFVRINVYHTEMVEKVVFIDNVELTGSIDEIYAGFAKLDQSAGYYICTQACCTKSVAATGLVPEEVLNV
jgi:hypothetical protein